MSRVQADLDIYELAYLTGGKTRVISTVIVSLIERGLLVWDAEQQKIVPIAANSMLLTNMEQKIWDVIIVNDIKKLKYIYLPEIGTIQQHLKGYGINENNGCLSIIFFFFGAPSLMIALVILFHPIMEPFKQSPLSLPVLLIFTLIFIYIFFYMSLYILKFEETTQIRKCEELLETYRERTPLQIPDCNRSLSKSYALYGKTVLPNDQFKELLKYLNAQLQPNLESRRINQENGDLFDFEFDNNSDSSSSDSGFDSGSDSGGDGVD